MLAPIPPQPELPRPIKRQAANRKTASESDRHVWQDEMISVLEYVRGSSAISAFVRPSSPQNCSDELLREIVRIAEREDLIFTPLLEENRRHRTLGRSPSLPERNRSEDQETQPPFPAVVRLPTVSG